MTSKLCHRDASDNAVTSQLTRHRPRMLTWSQSLVADNVGQWERTTFVRGLVEMFALPMDLDVSHHSSALTTTTHSLDHHYA